MGWDQLEWYEKMGWDLWDGVGQGEMDRVGWDGQMGWDSINGMEWNQLGWGVWIGWNLGWGGLGSVG